MVAKTTAVRSPMATSGMAVDAPIPGISRRALALQRRLGSATVACLVAFALVPDARSIVAPSLRCGATGRGRLSARFASRAMPLCWTLDKIGQSAAPSRIRARACGSTA